MLAPGHLNKIPRVDPFTVSATISRPREEVFEYLADIANHPEFTDHYLVDWHLTREDPYGRGAGARFKIKAPLARFNWGDLTLAEVQPPHKIVEHGRWGKFNRIRMLGTYTLSPGPAGTTVVEFEFETVPVMPSDHLMEALGGRSWTKRQAARGMRRLRSILEEDRGRGQRATIAGR
jgi:uncharacterized protein YndB with AHSA1/START domain